MSGDTRVLGLDDLKRRFAQLPTQFGKKVLRKGAGAGARVIKVAQIAGAPKKTGRLKSAAIIKFVRERSNDNQATYIVTFRQGRRQQALKRGRGKSAKLVNLDAYYARFVERGHRNVARFKGKYTDYRLRGGRRLTGLSARRKASNTSTPPHPFFAPALRASQSAALDAEVMAMEVEAKKLLG